MLRKTSSMTVTLARPMSSHDDDSHTIGGADDATNAASNLSVSFPDTAASMMSRGEEEESPSAPSSRPASPLKGVQGPSTSSTRDLSTVRKSAAEKPFKSTPTGMANNKVPPSKYRSKLNSRVSMAQTKKLNADSSTTSQQKLSVFANIPQKRKPWNTKATTVDFNTEIQRASTPVLSIVDRTKKSTNEKAPKLQHMCFRPETQSLLAPKKKFNATSSNSIIAMGNLRQNSESPPRASTAMETRNSYFAASRSTTATSSALYHDHDGDAMSSSVERRSRSSSQSFDEDAVLFVDGNTTVTAEGIYRRDRRHGDAAPQQQQQQKRPLSPSTLKGLRTYNAGGDAFGNDVDGVKKVSATRTAVVESASDPPHKHHHRHEVPATKNSSYLHGHVFRPASAMTVENTVSCSKMHDRVWEDHRMTHSPARLTKEEKKQLHQPRKLDGDVLLYPNHEAVLDKQAKLQEENIKAREQEIIMQQETQAGSSGPSSRPQTPCYVMLRPNSAASSSVSRPTSALSTATLDTMSSTAKHPAKKALPKYDQFGAKVREGDSVHRVFEESNGFVTFEGRYENNVRDGPGTIVLSDGTTLEGTFTNGEMEGYGAKSWPEGSRYQGYFHKGEPHGHGEFFGTGGEYYNGDHQFGMRCGQGIFKRYQRVVYEGSFKNHQFHGEGKLVIRNDKTITGTFAKGKPHGKNIVCTYDCGDKYSGAYENGLESGEGTFFAGSTRVTYTGPFREGARARLPNALMLSKLDVHAPEKVERGLWREATPDPYTNVRMYTPITLKVALGAKHHAISGVATTLMSKHKAAAQQNAPQSSDPMASSNNNLKGEGLFVPQRRSNRNQPNIDVRAAQQQQQQEQQQPHALLSPTSALSRGSKRNLLQQVLGGPKEPPPTPQYEETGRSVECIMLRVPQGVTNPSTITSPLVAAGTCQLFSKHLSEDEVNFHIGCALNNDGKHKSGTGLNRSSSRYGRRQSNTSLNSQDGQRGYSIGGGPLASRQQSTVATAEIGSTTPEPTAVGGTTAGGDQAGFSFLSPDRSSIGGFASGLGTWHDSPLQSSPMIGVSRIGEETLQHNNFSAVFDGGQRLHCTMLVSEAEEGVASFTIRPSAHVDAGEYVLVVNADPSVVPRPGGASVTAPSVAPLVVPIRLFSPDRQTMKDMKDHNRHSSVAPPGGLGASHGHFGSLSGIHSVSE